MIQVSLDLSGEHNPHYGIGFAGFKAYGTSYEAAEQITPTIKAAHAQLLALLEKHPNGLTADEAGRLLGWSAFYARPRMSELHSARFLIKKIGRAINPDTGKAANVWGLV